MIELQGGAEDGVKVTKSLSKSLSELLQPGKKNTHPPTCHLFRSISVLYHQREVYMKEEQR